MKGTVETALTERWSLRSLTPRDVAEVRDLAAQRVREWGYVADDASLVLTEMLANVVAHADGRAVAFMQVRGTHLFIAVSDTNPTEPRLVEPDWESDGGRGVVLINSLASLWGCQPIKCGKCVWALVPLLPRCHGCGTPVEKDTGDDIFVCRVLQDGQPDLLLIYCPACSTRMVRQRSGRDSGWGVAPQCKALIAH